MLKEPINTAADLCSDVHFETAANVAKTPL
jgi:hypothetical protein